MFRRLPSGSVNKLSFKLSFFDSFLFHVNDLSWPLAIEHGLNRVGQGGEGGGSGIPVYPKKNSQKYPKIPKIHPNIPRYIFRYTLYLEFKENDTV